MSTSCARLLGMGTAEMRTGWLVHSEWLPLPGSRSPERIALPYPDRAAAERAALHTMCCRGARYVSVEGPDSVVTLDWDRYTNRARRYALSSDQAQRDLVALVEPQPRLFDHVVDLAADDDLVPGGDRRGFYRGEQRAVGLHLVGVDFVLPAGAGREQAVLDRDVGAGAGDRVVVVVEASRVAEDHRLGVARSERHQ